MYNKIMAFVSQIILMVMLVVAQDYIIAAVLIAIVGIYNKIDSVSNKENNND